MPMALQAADASAAVAPAAHLAYGGLMADGLHRRLGEIRYILPTDAWGGEAFVRHAHTRFDDGAARATQLGASAVYWNEDGASHRVGWALDRGSLRTHSQANIDMKGLSASYTHQRNSGAYVDAVLGRVRPARGNASTGGSQWAVALEAGAPFPFGENMAIEPQLQLRHQTLRVGAIRARQTTVRQGTRLARIDNERFVPYAQLDLERQLGRTSKALPGSVPLEAAVRNGTSIRLSAGFTIKVHRVVDVYADAGVQRRLAGGGSAGGTFQAGIRINV